MSIIRLRENMQKWTKVVIIVLAVAVSAGMVGLGFSGLGRNNQKDNYSGVGGVIARVNGEKMDGASFEKNVEAQLKQIEKDKTLSPFEAMKTRGRIFDSMVDQMLLMQAAKKEGITVSRGDVNSARDKAVDMQLEQIKQQAMTGYTGKDPKFFENVLKRQDLTIDKLKSQIRDGIDINKVEEQVSVQKLGEKITGGIDNSDAAIRASFDQFQISRITIGSTSRSAVQAEIRAKEVVSKLNNGGDFATVAKEYSEDPLKSKGGTFGQFIGKGMMEPELDTALSTLQIGHFSDPIKTAQGYVIVKLNAKKNALPADYNDSKKRKMYIDQYMGQKKYELQNKYFENLRKSAKIEILNPELKAYSMLKDLNSPDITSPADRKAKVLATIEEFQRAALGAGQDTSSMGRSYSSIAYLYELLRSPGLVQLSKEDQAKYKAEEKTALQSALGNSESNDLRMMLASILIADGENDKALENLSIVTDNAYDDYQTQTQVLGLYKSIKNGGPKVASLIAKESKWLADNKQQQQPASGMPMMPGR